MGWWKIDPSTGAPLDEPSASSSDEVILLNAVPGVDDDGEAHYLGDGPLDMAYSLSNELRDLLGDSTEVAAVDALKWLLDGAPLAALGESAMTAAEIQRLAEGFWDDVDSCYEDDWDRKALSAERRFIAQHAVERAGLR
jgi:hypothetical protein